MFLNTSINKNAYQHCVARYLKLGGDCGCWYELNGGRGWVVQTLVI